jgi:TonB family protein
MNARGAISCLVVALPGWRAIAQTPGDTTVHPSDNVDERPVLIGQSQGAYRTCLRDAGVRGREVVRLIVDTTGHVESGSVTLDTPRQPILDSVTVATARGLAFRPARRGGSPVRVEVTVPLDFDGPLPAVASVDSAVFSLECVDRAPAFQPSGPVLYPETMVASRIAGEAVVEFVLDTAGRVEPHSIQIVRSSHRAFGSVAQDAVRHGRFVPARLDGVLVRCRVRMPFRFEIGRPGQSVSNPQPQTGELPALVITAWVS